ncbi:MAG: TonB-dependent receptor, partial [Moraxellaceae bacterium]
YALNDAQQVFANASQGFSLPDIQRMLRDVQPGFVVNSANIEPIKVNNYELGWRMQGNDGLNLGLTGFYNTSDKVTQFNRDFSVTVADTDERVYGAEANLSVPVLSQFKVGGTLAYTRGQFKDAAGAWRELNAYRVSPLKGTLFGEWNDDNDNGLRVQMLAIAGSDRAYNDARQAAYNNTVRATPASKIKGYAVMDVLAHATALGGRIDFGVYNVWNTAYRSVYSQEAAATYGLMSSIPAEGRTYGLSYTIRY